MITRLETPPPGRRDQKSPRKDPPHRSQPWGAPRLGRSRPPPQSGTPPLTAVSGTSGARREDYEAISETVLGWPREGFILGAGRPGVTVRTTNPVGDLQTTPLSGPGRWSN